MLTREERNNISHSLKASELRRTCNIEITMRRSPVSATLRDSDSARVILF